MLPENFKDSILWKDLMEKTSKFPELNGDMEYLLEDVIKNYIPHAKYPKVDFNKCLFYAFHWEGTPQKHDFWWEIYCGILPEEYT